MLDLTVMDQTIAIDGCIGQCITRTTACQQRSRIYEWAVPVNPLPAKKSCIQEPMAGGFDTVNQSLCLPGWQVPVTAAQTPVLWQVVLGDPM